MKKLLSFVLSLMLLFSVTAMAEGEASAALPIFSQLDQATLVEDSAFPFYYENASEDDLYHFIVLSTALGAYPLEIPNLEDMIGYYLIVPGTDFLGRILFSPADKVIAVDANQDFIMYTDAVHEMLLSMLTQEVKLPANATKNTLPGFYAIAGAYDMGNQMAFNSVFDGKLAWTELYNGVTNDTVNEYTIMMYLFGFDVTATSIAQSDDGLISNITLEYTNGEYEVIVKYDALEQYAYVHHEPGIVPLLLDGQQLSEALGQ